MKLPLIIALLGLCTLEASSRRDSRQDQDQALGPAIIEFPDTLSEVALDKNALRSYRHLHRQGLLAFHQKRYNEALQCFGLALEHNPRSIDLSLDYALFCLLIPDSEGRNLTLAKNLLEQIARPEARKDPRFYLTQAILSWLEGQDQQAMFNLSHLKKTPYEPVSDLFELHLQLGARTINPLWAERVIPIRLSPMEKREIRSNPKP